MASDAWGSSPPQEQGTGHYVDARNGCEALAVQFEDALSGVDALVTPTMATEPIERGTWTPHSYSAGGQDAAPPLAVNTRPANLAGLPAITVPIDTDGALPIGLQFIGVANEDAVLFGVAAAVEQFGESD